MQRTIPPPPKAQGSILLEDPFLGMEIGALRIIELIGEGGFGAVYKALNLHTQTHQAIKILRVNRNAHLKQAIHERFQREAHILQQLDHPYIVRSGEFGQIADGVFYLVMEYLQGESLHERRLRLQQIPPTDLLRWLPQLGSALQYIHQREIIHRDLKPENLFLHRAHPHSEEVLKLLDFGIASAAAESSITQTGKAFGSPLYMSPEQVKGEGKRATPQTDIYSLGVILFEALTGVPPFQGEGPAIMFAHIMTPPPRLSHICPNIPWNAPIEQTLQRALAKEPEERWPTIQAMLQPLLQGLQQLALELSNKTSGDLSRLTAPQRGTSAFAQSPPLLRSPDLIYQDDDDHHQTAAMTPPALAHLSILSDPFAQEEATLAKPSSRIGSFDQLPATQQLTSTQEEIEVAFIEQDEILDLDTAHADLDLPSSRAPMTPLPRQTTLPSPTTPPLPPPAPPLKSPHLPLHSASPHIPPPPPPSRPLTPAPPSFGHASLSSSASPPQTQAASSPSPLSSHPPLPFTQTTSTQQATTQALSAIAPSRSTALPWLLLILGFVLLLFGLVRLLFNDEIHRAEQVLPHEQAFPSKSTQTQPPAPHSQTSPFSPDGQPSSQNPNPHTVPSTSQKRHPAQHPSHTPPFDPKHHRKQPSLKRFGKQRPLLKKKKKKTTSPQHRKKDPRGLFEFEPELSP